MTAETMEPASARSAVLRAAAYGTVAGILVHPGPGWRRGVVRRARDLAAEVARSGEECSGVREASALLDGIAARVRRTPLARAVMEYGVVFGHSVAGPCTPYEAEYGARSEAAFAQRIADVTAFYRAFGLALSPQAMDRPDHLAVECEFMHFLACKEAYARERGTPEQVETCRRAQREFVRSHLACWAGPFAKSFETVADGGALAGLGKAVAALVRADLAAFEVRDDEVHPWSAPSFGPPREADVCMSCDLATACSEKPAPVAAAP